MLSTPYRRCAGNDLWPDNLSALLARSQVFSGCLIDACNRPQWYRDKVKFILNDQVRPRQRTVERRPSCAVVYVTGTLVSRRRRSKRLEGEVWQSVHLDSTKPENGIQQTPRKPLNSQIDRGKQPVAHEYDVSPVGVGNGDFMNRIIKRQFAPGFECTPAVAGKKGANLIYGSRFAGDRGLRDQQADPTIRIESAEKTNIVPKQLVVELPTLKVIDRRSALVFIDALDDFHTKKAWPGGFEKCGRWLTIPDLVLVSLIGRRAIQFGRRSTQEEAFPAGFFAKDGKLFCEMGRTALKARNCLAASSEDFNEWREREVLRILPFNIDRHYNGESGVASDE